MFSDKQKICYIMGAGCYYGGFSPRSDGENVLVIAADGGLDTLKKLGTEPDIIIGDFDSAGQKPNGGNVISLPKIKDDTDTLAAIRLGLEHGCKKFRIYGGMGGRPDHTIANIQSLSFLCSKGAEGRLYGDNVYLEMLENRAAVFSEEMRGYVSVFAYGGEAVVTLRGLKYELEGAVIAPDFPIGVSNEFCGRPSYIEAVKGRVLITVSIITR